MTEMTTDDRIEWYVASGMSREEAALQVQADEVVDDIPLTTPIDKA